VPVRFESESESSFGLAARRGPRFGRALGSRLGRNDRRCENRCRLDDRLFKFDGRGLNLGLRLEDVDGLETEDVYFRNRDKAAANLAENGTAPEEIEFLLERRVELNAFASDELIDWLERKLKEHGIRKVIPAASTLAGAYQRMRKQALVVDKLEKLAVADARHAVDFAEVVVLLLDATRGLEVQDLKIANLILEEGRALMVAINKWDVAEEASGLFNGIRAALDEGLAQLKGVPLLAVSARTGKGLDQLLAAAFEIREQWSRRVPTAALNRWFDKAMEANPPPAPGGRRIKLRYITQNTTRPPSFVVFGTRLDDLPPSYERYLVNGIRRALGFGAVPVRLTLKSPKNPFAES